MNEESKLIELFKKYPGIAARIRRSTTILFLTRYQGVLRTRNHRDSRAYINRIQNSHPKQRNQMKKKPKYTYLTRINGMNTFLLQVNQIPITTQIQEQPSTSTYVPKTN